MDLKDHAPLRKTQWLTEKSFLRLWEIYILYNNHAPASFKVVPVESEKVTVDFHSKKEAEEEIKNFNKDLKDATYLFEVGVSLLG